MTHKDIATYCLMNQRIAGERCQRVEDRRLWIDIRADKEEENLAILIEVKGFEGMPSPIEYLASAIGQQTLKHNRVRLIVFDPEREEIVAWID
jgi:hypothetical protein